MPTPRRLLAPLLVLSACAAPGKAPVDSAAAPDGRLAPEVRASLDPARMKAVVDALCEDDLGGRLAGSPGHLVAEDLVLSWMEESGLAPAGIDGTFRYPYAAEPVNGFYMVDAEGTVLPHDTDSGVNLMGIIEGSDPERAHETLVVMAHWDHLGVNEDGEVYNGAFDNAGGTALALEVARLFAEHGAPARSILFMFTDGEEAGLDSPKAWLEEPTLDPDDVLFAVSADPLGRGLLPDYAPIVLSGTERSPALLERIRGLEDRSDRPIVHVNRDLIPVFASDQDPFLDPAVGRPAAWMVTPGMSFYHTPGDDAETIDYRVLLDSAEFLAELLWDLGNATETWDYAGPQPLDAQAGRDVRRLLEGVAASGELVGPEYDMVEAYMGVIDEGIAAGDLEEIEGWEGYKLAIIYNVLFELSAAHPGPIPPPFPE
jgi:hypothetical protein